MTSRIVFLLAGAACLSLLAGCDDHKSSGQVGMPQQGKLYKDLDSCLAQTNDMDGVKTCREGYQQALDKMAEAPQYAEQARCEDVYGPGNCVPRGSVVSGGGGGFVPFMMGYMLGGFGGRTVYQPVFIDRHGATFAGSSVISRPSWSGSPPPAALHSSSVARGGFGGTAIASASAGG
jgi:uncharacterized protein YgiB involved in biofilm formation